ncbi:type II/IV secretion system protein [candidate division WS5 bacterium]|uniref:Type II/IV secretion system protein n=1 Tax=candidate division WS5 bacterium TaxID=2093353 RepID=A0A419DEP3_9BACT|nr:MAG: type II/IV secretion system protein [candidate division WS5 bacterium]
MTEEKVVVKNEQELGELLVKLGIISQKKLDLLKVESAQTGRPIKKILESLPEVSKEDLTKALAITMELPYVDLSKKKIDKAVLNIINRDIAEKYKLVPFGKVGDFLNVAMVDPNNIVAIEYIEKKTGLKLKPYFASEEGIKHVIEQYDDYSVEVQNVIGNMEKPPEISLKEEKDSAQKGSGEASVITQDAPITRALNTILEYAAKSRASDIHIEPRDKEIKVRYRIDGVLYNTMTLPKHIHPALVSRIKILSNLKIDEHRVPQDGRFQLSLEDREIDLRISITPIVYGEKVVIRLLDKSSGIITLENLGIKGRAFRIIEAATKKPNGMILSTGPTGSGKSTSLYAILSKINQPSVNIITIEDPVEYNVNGVNQIQVNNAVGLTFASGLRSILRQDPDVIMVGEIRDKETAELAVQSALTGHTVLSTLHTNSAAGALPRLLDMEIEPFLIASTVNTVIAQRLVRKICDHCKKEYKASPAMTEAIKKSLKNILPSKEDPKEKTKELGFDELPFSDENIFKLYKGTGCEFCKNTGYWGRTGVYEIFSVTEKIEDLITSNATSGDIQEAAVKEGMVTMRQDGFLKALAGITTIEEVVRTTTED